MTYRPDKDLYYLNIAAAVSLRSTCLRRRYGSVLVKNDIIIATGYNGSARGAVNCCDTGYCAREAANKPHNSDYDSTCLTGETVIKLLNGQYQTIQELAAIGQDFWTYSVNEEGLIVPALATNPRKTGTRNDIIEITFNDKTTLRCTSDHRIMLANGTYVMAKDAKINDSCMSLYYNFNRNQGYESISNVGHRSLGFFRHPDKFSKCNNYLTPTHQLVYEHFYGRPIDGYDYFLIHHIDHNRTNNQPDNLMLIERDQHSREHVTQEVIDRIKTASKKGHETMKRLLEEDPSIRQAMSQRGHTDMVQKWSTQEWRDYIRPTQVKNGQKRVQKLNSEEMRHLQSEGKILKGLTLLFAKMAIANDITVINDNTYTALQKKYTVRGFPHGKKPIGVPKYETILKYFQTLDNALNQARHYNHRIIKIKRLDIVVPVYDVTVPVYENFPVDLGNNSCIMVHNCPAIHSESNCLLSVSREQAVGSTLYLFGYDLIKHTIVKAVPCVMCQRLIQNCGVARVVGFDPDVHFLLSSVS